MYTLPLELNAGHWWLLLSSTVYVPTVRATTTFQDFVSRFVLRPHRDDTVIVIVIIAIVRNNAAFFLVRVLGRQDNIVNVKVVIGL